MNSHILEWLTSFPFIDRNADLDLEVPFVKDEIHEALKKADDDKTLGSDEFLFKFVQSFWHVFKDDLGGLYHIFHESVRFDHQFLEFFVFLIPKVKGSAFLNDFGPISLLKWVHKLVTHVLTARLLFVTDQLISHTKKMLSFEVKAFMIDGLLLLRFWM